MRKFEALNRDEVTAALMCSFKDIEDTLAKEVSCVGCRRSVESKLILFFLKDQDICFSYFCTSVQQNDGKKHIGRNPRFDREGH